MAMILLIIALLANIAFFGKIVLMAARQGSLLSPIIVNTAFCLIVIMVSFFLALSGNMISLFIMALVLLIGDIVNAILYWERSSPEVRKILIGPGRVSFWTGWMLLAFASVGNEAVVLAICGAALVQFYMLSIALGSMKFSSTTDYEPKTITFGYTLETFIVHLVSVLAILAHVWKW